MKKILIISATNDKNLVLAKELDNIISNMSIQTELLSVQDLGLPLFDFEKVLNNNLIDDLIDKLQKSGHPACRVTGVLAVRFRWFYATIYIY